MKSVLISIRPQWCEKIASSKKTIEVRKSAPKEVPFKGYIYATRPKKYYKCGAVSTSDELLWLANGKIKMGDGFGLWANGEDYQCVNGKVIGEFICDRIDEYKYVYCDHPEIGYPVGYDCGDNWYDIDDEDLQKACLTEEEFKVYGNGKPLYGWHISDLKIYDKPKELSEFYRPCSYSGICYSCNRFRLNGTPNDKPNDFCDGEITRPSQSYMIVKEVEGQNNNDN
jgi:predicted transcriptional regulator